MRTPNFGPKRFIKWAKKTHDSTGKSYGSIWNPLPTTENLRRLLDHGFIVDAAPQWMGIEGHEIAIISRTYCSDDEIDHPPEGLKCWRLPKELMRFDDQGTPIATVIVSATEAANEFLMHCQNLPAHMMGYAISRDMICDGCQVILDAKMGPPNYLLVKISPPTIHYPEGFYDE